MAQISLSNKPKPKPTVTSLAVQCARCTTKLEVPPYIDLLSESAAPRPLSSGKPLYCPRCGKARQIRPLDYADVLCQDYFGLTRKGAIETVTLFNELQAQGRLPSVKVYGRPQDPCELLRHVWGFPLALARSAITPLTVHCRSCAGSYTLLRGKPDVQQTPPLYCVWCASSDVYTSQDDTEETAWLSLASHYDLSVQAVQFFYNDWQGLPAHTYTTFAAYLDSPTVKPLVEATRHS